MAFCFKNNKRDIIMAKQDEEDFKLIIFVKLFLKKF